MATKIDSGLRKLACELLTKHLKRLKKQFSGLKKPRQIDYVHDARVACRRIRVTLDFFPEAFSAKRCRRWRKAIHGLGQTLGPARDLDVHIAAMQNLIRDNLVSDAVEPGLKWLLRDLRRRRKEQQSLILHALRDLKHGGPLRDLEKYLRKQRQRLNNAQFDPNTPAARDLLKRQITIGIRDLHELRGPGLSSQYHHQHRFRIAAKKLRYILEIGGQMYPKRYDEAIRSLIMLQDCLGAIRDCYTWRQEIENLLAGNKADGQSKEKSPKVSDLVRPGLLLMARKLRRQEKNLWDRLQKIWGRIRQAGLLRVDHILRNKA